MSPQSPDTETDLPFDNLTSAELDGWDFSPENSQNFERRSDSFQPPAPASPPNELASFAPPTPSGTGQSSASSDDWDPLEGWDPSAPLDTSRLIGSTEVDAGQTPRPMSGSTISGPASDSMSDSMMSDPHGTPVNAQTSPSSAAPSAWTPPTGMPSPHMGSSGIHSPGIPSAGTPSVGTPSYTSLPQMESSSANGSLQFDGPNVEGDLGSLGSNGTLGAARSASGGNVGTMGNALAQTKPRRSSGSFEAINSSPIDEGISSGRVIAMAALGGFVLVVFLFLVMSLF